ncbi:MAG: FAD-dependent oxidoreductase [Burkholderiales bacterium]|nr:FAD-dependent oxidoreductase [Burkholderiales bacterium]
MNAGRVVIVGAGHAGWRTAQTLRAGGWPGEITLIGEESGSPYDRTSVSKAILFQHAEPKPLGPTDFSYLPGQRVRHIDRAARQVIIGGTPPVGYDHLVLATGARPRHLGLGECALRGVFSLRSATDAAALRRSLEPGARLVIVGGGLIGLEVAAGAVRAGLDVTVLEATPRIMARVLPEAISAALADEHSREGIRILFNVAPVCISCDNDLAVTLSSGVKLVADIVLVAIGVTPNSELAVGAGLDVSNGVVVDATLATPDPTVSAIGDVAYAQHPLFGVPLRLESQQAAEEHGSYVARRLMGRGSDFRGVPWAWSDQYDKVVQIAGVPALASQVVLRDFEDEGLVACHLADDGRLLAATGFGNPKLIAQEIGSAKRLIARSISLEVGALSNPSRALRSLDV